MQAVNGRHSKVRSVSADAVAYAARIVRGEGDDPAEEARSLGTITQLEATARLTAAGSMEGYRRQRHVDLLIVGSLSAMAAARDARDARDGQSAIDPALPGHLDQAAELLNF